MSQLDNGKIVNVPITGFPCHFWDNEENLEIEYTDTGIIVSDSCETSVNQIIFDNFVPLVIDAKYFEECTGDAPINDDLERVNCNEHGLGHYHCGWNHKLNMPVFMYGR